MELRDYQQGRSDDLVLEWDHHDRVLAVMATGTGKSFWAGHLAQRWLTERLWERYGLNASNVLLMGYTDEQIDQLAEHVQNWTGQAPAIEKGEKKIEKRMRDLGRQVVVSSVQTMMREKRLQGFRKDHFGLVLWDESHHAITEGAAPILDHFHPVKMCGLTGTPNREDEVPLGKVFDGALQPYWPQDAIADGWLCRLKIAYVSHGEPDWEKAKLESGLSEERFAEIIEEESDAAHLIVRSIVDLAGDRPTLVYAPRVAAAEALAGMLNRYRGESVARFICGKTPAQMRRATVQEFREGEFPYLCNAQVLTEGADIRNASCIALARSVKSRMLLAQIIGRVLRGGPRDPVPGKVDALFLDLLGSSRNAQFVHPVDVLGGRWEKCVRDEAFHQLRLKASDVPQDVLDAIMDAKARADEIRAEERRRIIVEAKSKVRSVDPFLNFAEAAENLDLSEEICPGWWANQLATEEQREELKKGGIPPDRIKALTRHQADQLVRALRQRNKEGVCSYRQANLLRARGLDPCMSKAEAGVLMSYFKRTGLWKPGQVDWRRISAAKKQGRPFRFDELKWKYHVPMGTEAQTHSGSGYWEPYYTSRDLEFTKFVERDSGGTVFESKGHFLRVPNNQVEVELLPGWKTRSLT